MTSPSPPTITQPTTKELQLHRALDESKKALGEVVEECVFMESELTRYKQALAQLQQDGSGNAAAKSLKVMMQEQQEQFKEEKQRLEIELQQALSMLKQQQQQQQQQKPKTPSPLKTNNNNNNVISIFDAPSSDNMLVTVSRVSQLERIAGEERAKREELMEQLTIVERERDMLKLDLQSFRTENHVSREEIETEREQRRAMRDEFERLQRNSEASAREQRASEKRYEGLMEEMRQVMRERDDAISHRDEARFHASELDRAAQVFKLEADEAKAAKDVLIDRALAAERARDIALTQKESEERMRVAAMGDLETIKQQVGTLVVERDSALNENEWIMKRLDALQIERRDLTQERSRAMERMEELQRQNEGMESKFNQQSRRVVELEAIHLNLQSELAKASKEISDLSNQLLRSKATVQEAEEYKSHADREIEAARRQVKALNDEMMSVLKARDLALRQRDEFSNAVNRMKTTLVEEQTKATETITNEMNHLRKELNVTKQQLIESENNIIRLTQTIQQQKQQLHEAQINNNSNTTIPNNFGVSIIELRSILRGTIAELQMDVLLGSSGNMNAPSPPRLPTMSRFSGNTRVGIPIETFEEQLSASLMEARDVSIRIGSLRDKLRASVEAERNASKRAEQLEWKLIRNVNSTAVPPTSTSSIDNMTNSELNRLRQRAAELERELISVTTAPSNNKQISGNNSTSGGNTLDARVRNSTVVENENVLLRQEVRSKTSELDALREQREVLYREVEALNLKLQRATPHKNEVDGLRIRLKNALSDLDRKDEEIRKLKGTSNIGV
jgi:hypothetical protein